MNEKARKLWIKVMAIVLAALMVGGTAYGFIAMLFT